MTAAKNILLSLIGIGGFVLPIFAFSDEAITICNSVPLSCKGEELNLAKAYYENRGEWANQFTMTPLQAEKADETHCDIKYSYQSLSDAGYKGLDSRKFGFQFEKTSCGWTATSMGKYMSGTLIKITATELFKTGQWLEAFLALFR